MTFHLANSTTSTTASQAESTTKQANGHSTVTPFDEPLYSDLIEYDPSEMPRVLFEAVMRQSLEKHQSTRSRQQGGKR